MKERARATADHYRLSPLTNPTRAQDILTTAVELGVPVGQVLARLERYAPLGLELPAVDPAAVAELRPDREDLVALSRNLDGVAPWLEGQLPWMHLVGAAIVLVEPIEVTQDRVRRLCRAGFSLPEGPCPPLPNGLYVL